MFQKALAASDQISAILTRPKLAKDTRLHDQLGASSERVASLIAEGFGQDTDRHFSAYLYRARGSSKEVRTQLHVACTREYLSEAEFGALTARYNEIERMLTGLIRYLQRSDRIDRG